MTDTEELMLYLKWRDATFEEMRDELPSTTNEWGDTLKHPVVQRIAMERFKAITERLFG